MNGWEQRYRRTVIISDTVATALVVAAIGNFFGSRDAANWHEKWGILAFGTELLVLGALAVNRSWAPAVLGQGAEEFRRLGRSLFTATVVLALGGIALTSRNIKLWIFVAIPAIALVTMTERYLLRLGLHKQRYEGRCLRPVLAAGSPATVRDLISRTRKFPHLGWRVDAVCTTDGLGLDGDQLDGVPVVGRLTDVAGHVRRDGYRVVAVTPDPHWSPDRLQRLAWNLEGSDAEMVVAPVLMEVAGPRLHVDAVLGIPLLRVSMPTFTGGRRAVKGVVDRVAAAVLLMLFAPLMVFVALLVLVDSRGGAVYRQRRVGKDGREFTILKFRTMVAGAHGARAELAGLDEGAGLLFKLRRDPRVTRVGAGAAPVLDRRTAAAFQRAHRLDVARRSAAAVAGGVRCVRPGHPATAAGQARTHRPVADQRTQRPAVGGGGPPRPAVRGGLVARPGHSDLVEDAACRAPRAGGLLMRGRQRLNRPADAGTAGHQGLSGGRNAS